MPTIQNGITYSQPFTLSTPGSYMVEFVVSNAGNPGNQFLLCQVTGPGIGTTAPLMSLAGENNLVLINASDPRTVSCYDQYQRWYPNITYTLNLIPQDRYGKTDANSVWTVTNIQFVQIKV